MEQAAALGAQLLGATLEERLHLCQILPVGLRKQMFKRHGSQLVMGVPHAFGNVFIGLPHAAKAVLFKLYREDTSVRGLQQRIELCRALLQDLHNLLLKRHIAEDKHIASVSGALRADPHGGRLQPAGQVNAVVAVFKRVLFAQQLQVLAQQGQAVLAKDF